MFLKSSLSPGLQTQNTGHQKERINYLQIGLRLFVQILPGTMGMG